MPSLIHLPTDSAPEAVYEVIYRDGGVIIDDMLTTEQFKRYRSELQPYIDKTPGGEDDFSGRKTVRVGGLFVRSSVARELAVHPLVNAMCEKVLGPFCDAYQINITQCISIGPGEGLQPLHRDRIVWGDYVPRSIETQLSTIVAVTDFTKENGATRIVPGSHLWEEEREPTPDEICQAEMTAGSALIYNGNIIHGGGANSTDEHRIAALIHYTLGWLRQEENQYLSYPPEIAKSFSEELRRLIGYSCGGPMLGFFTEPVGPGEQTLPLCSPEVIFGGAEKLRGGMTFFDSGARVTSKGFEKMDEAVAES